MAIVMILTTPANVIGMGETVVEAIMDMLTVLIVSVLIQERCKGNVIVAAHTLPIKATHFVTTGITIVGVIGMEVIAADRTAKSATSHIVPIAYVWTLNLQNRIVQEIAERCGGRVMRTVTIGTIIVVVTGMEAIAVAKKIRTNFALNVFALIRPTQILNPAGKSTELGESAKH